MPDENTYKSLRNIIDYLYADEQKDFEATIDPELKEQHIFNDILAVTNYVDEIKKEY